jgi:diguanylate cyclase (GGDEF)-like protein
MGPSNSLLGDRTLAGMVGLSADAEGALQVLAEAFGRDIGARASVVAVLDAERGQAAVAAAWGDDGFGHELDAPALGGLIARAMGTGAPLLEPSDGHQLVAVPVAAGEAVQGALVALIDRPGQVDPVSLAHRDYATLVAVCLRDTAETGRLRELSRHDDLTGCLNEVGVRSVVTGEIARSERHGRPLCVCLIDLDDFKRVNDRNGRPAGDRVLAQVGHTLREATRGHDAVGRIGGDEFLVVMAEVRLARAKAAAQRLVAAIAHAPVAFGGVSVGASFGVAEWRPGTEVDDLLDEADNMLRAGRPAGAGPRPPWTDPDVPLGQ